MPKKMSEQEIAEELEKIREEQKAVYGRPDLGALNLRESQKRRRKMAFWGVAFLIFLAIALVLSLINKFKG